MNKGGLVSGNGMISDAGKRDEAMHKVDRLTDEQREVFANAINNGMQTLTFKDMTNNYEGYTREEVEAKLEQACQKNNKLLKLMGYDKFGMNEKIEGEINTSCLNSIKAKCIKDIEDAK